MIQKQLLVPDRVRRPPREGWSWIDRRFLKQHASRLSHEAILLYFFLAAVSDQNGLSFYSDTSTALRLRMTVLVRASATELRIVCQGQEVTRHQRSFEKGQLVVHPDHRLAALKARGRRRASQREEEFDALGPVAREFHQKLLSAPVQPGVHLRRLLGLVRLYGRHAVLAAIGQALRYQTYDAAYVETLLLQDRRRQELPSPMPLRPKRPELIEDIHLEEPDPARYDHLCRSSDEQEPTP